MTAIASPGVKAPPVMPSDPLHIDFAIKLTTNDMAPAYRQGDTVFLRHRKAEPVELGADYLMAKGKDSDVGLPGGRYCILARLAGKTRSHWLATKHNPAKRQRLPRSVWRPAYVVVGCYRTGKGGAP